MGKGKYYKIIYVRGQKAILTFKARKSGKIYHARIQILNDEGDKKNGIQ